MKNLMVCTAVALLLFSANIVSAQEKNFIDTPYIEVTGKAEMEVVPDEIYVGITINEKDNKGKVSVDQQEQEMFKQLKEIGIDVEKDLVVQDMSSDLQSFFLRKDAILTSKSYQLKVNSATQLGKAFQALQAAGISDVRIERTDISNIDELRQEVRVKAIQAAKRNAEVLAEAIGQKARWAIYIQDYGFNMRPYSNVMFAKSAQVAMDEAVVAAPMPQLEFQKIKIEHSVMARFILGTSVFSNGSGKEK